MDVKWRHDLFAQLAVDVGRSAVVHFPTDYHRSQVKVISEWELLTGQLLVH